MDQLRQLMAGSWWRRDDSQNQNMAEGSGQIENRTDGSNYQRKQGGSLTGNMPEGRGSQNRTRGSKHQWNQQGSRGRFQNQNMAEGNGHQNRTNGSNYQRTQRGSQGGSLNGHMPASRGFQNRTRGSKQQWNQQRSRSGSLNRNMPESQNETSGPRRDDQERPGTSHSAHNENFKGNNRRVPRQMGFAQLEKLLECDNMEKVIFDLTNDKLGFTLVLSNDKLSGDTIVLVVNLLSKICEYSFNSPKIMLLQLALKSSFMNTLKSYVLDILSHTENQKKKNRYFWSDPNKFLANICTISRMIHDLIPTSCEEIRKVLKTVDVVLPNIVSEHQIDVNEDVKETIRCLITVMEDTMKAFEKQEIKKNEELVEEEPPDDFHDIPVLPSADEIMCNQQKYLRKNIVRGKYRDVQQYLDIQFRLLREDFVRPLRMGIQEFRKNTGQRIQDIRIHKSVKFVRPEVCNDKYSYLVQLDPTKHQKRDSNQNSKHFMFGSLLVFTCNNFETLLFGQIAKRDEKLLNKGQIVVGFSEKFDITDKEYVMVESKVYFEPYWQVLNALKSLSLDHLPMERYILYVEGESQPPHYLLEKDVTYRIENTMVRPLYWTDRKFFNFNDKQQEAFRAALTKEFAVIQGPPGTGKTFVGLRIVETLLKNYEKWYHDSPILVICFTNHALDQFLEGLLQVTEKIVRVGGQSKSETMNKYNLQKRKMERDASLHQRFWEMRECMDEITTINQKLDQIDSSDCIVKFQLFTDIIHEYNGSWFRNASENEIVEWLLVGMSQEAKVNRDYNQKVDEDVDEEAIENLEVDDINISREQATDFLDDSMDLKSESKSLPSLLDIKDMKKSLNICHNEIVRLNQSDMSNIERYNQELALHRQMWYLDNAIDYLEKRMVQKQKKKRFVPDFIDLRHPEKMAPDDRWLLYFQWLRRARSVLLEKKNALSTGYAELYKLYNDMKSMEEVQYMKKMLVIGMTTTGAARLHSSLKALKSPIVVVEEAAEVLESHIITALTAHCQHLILIGDHQQLKPSTANYHIGTRYDLGISLFERMVLNGIQCHTLNTQHRMRPEIAQLVCPAIYPELFNHESTLQRSPIVGMEKDLFFLNHEYPEVMCGDMSKKNSHEAKFLIALARHLVLNGHQPEDITIVAAYLGQMFKFLREKAKNLPLLQNVRIVVLDNYQGEESKIVLLSLVRNNKEGKIGFLKLENRVCVALSRARDGFYIMGNIKLLSENGEVWQKVRTVLENQEALGDQLALRCQVHRDQVTLVSQAQDFECISEGGCTQMCGVELGCGHRCTRLCHILDRDHINYKCMEKCDRQLCNNVLHICQKKCYENCGPCTYPVTETLDCGHTVILMCHEDPNTFKCYHKVSTKLPCGHQADKPCHADPDTFDCPEPCDTRVEPCGHQCKMRCHFRQDPDHLKYKCRMPCGKPKKHCKNGEEFHICTKLCFDECEECNVSVKKFRTICPHVYTIACKVDVDQILCEKPCSKILPCGHKCPNKCHEPCGNCKKVVKKTLPACGHEVKIACEKEPKREDCTGKCPLKLRCGHDCKKRCCDPCTTQCKALVECYMPLLCGHKLKSAPCFYRDSGGDILQAYCLEPCNTELKCGHKCVGKCGTCNGGRIHVRCQEPCGVPLVCGHLCGIACRMACKPCEKPCMFRCTHSKCKKKCGEPCTPCQQKCRRSCTHQNCTKPCGQICNVPPCNQPCPKRLRCGHECVGFCGDPCPPLCRTCDTEELQEIFFGTEDDENARFVLLLDCKHLVENEGMELWLQSENDKVKGKECPKCKTPILTTPRYSDYVKRSMRDLFTVKVKSFGGEDENQKKASELTLGLAEVTSKYSNLMKVSGKLPSTLEVLMERLRASKNNRRQPINKIELNAIEAKLQMIQHIVEIVGKDHTFERSDDSIKIMDCLLNVILRSDDHITDQEIEDLRLEIDRLNRAAQFDKMKKSREYGYARSNPKIQSLVSVITVEINRFQRYNSDLDRALQEKLNELKKEINCSTTISDVERRQIVQAIGLTPGHWFRCPNGHLYAIGECGGAMQISKCNECGEAIGGQNHRLLDGQQLARDFDGATEAAWPGVHL